ncbi:MAG: STAS domain-containing protein [Clostridia bacterium]|nr:STAS domain-containing protein [Clostridia bacterium]
MDKLKPKLFSVLKNYTAAQFGKDVVAGIIVAIIALPLSIALALASGVTPEMGIYTAIFAGFVISFLGGSRVQIAGPTAAFATIVAGVVAANGIEGLMIATLMAGVILILMGLLRLGKLIKFIPYPITIGFTAGIAVTIVVGQIKDFLGLTIQSAEPLIETMEKVEGVVNSLNTFNWQALLVGGVSLLVLILWPLLPGFFKKIPPSLIAVLVGIGMVAGFSMEVNTIGDLYTISGGLPQLTLPAFNGETLEIAKNVLPDAFTIAILAAIESLLSCVVADGMIGSRHRSNMELVAQGAGNITSAMFGGIPATGAIARTAANVKNGGRTPVAGMVHAVVLLLVLLVLMPYAALIPMPTIAAILFMVAYNMCGWRTFVRICKTAPKSDVLVLVITFVLTVVFDLVVAIIVGILLAAVLLLKRMSDVTHVEGWKDGSIAEELANVPANAMVYEITGSLFFGAADELLTINAGEGKNCLILRMVKVGFVDGTVLHNLESLVDTCKQKDVQIILSHVNPQPMAAMKKAGIIDLVGEEFVCDHIDAALAKASSLAKAEETVE